MAIKLTTSEVRQCYHGIEFALTDFRKAKADVIDVGIMTEPEAKQREQSLIDLKDKLLSLYYDLGGE